MRAAAMSAGMRARRARFRRSLRRSARRGARTLAALGGACRAALEARLQSRHQIDHLASRGRARLGDRDSLTLHLALDRLLDSRLDLVGVRRRIESLGALLLDELAGEPQLRVAHLGALDPERIDGLHLG